MSLFDILTSSKQIESAPTIQPLPSTVGSVFHVLKGIAVEPILTNPYSNELMGTSPVGFTEPNPIMIHGIPPAQTIISTPTTRQSNAPIQKGCN